MKRSETTIPFYLDAVPQEPKEAIKPMTTNRKITARNCPHCNKPVDTAFCPGCGLKIEPLKVLLGYCCHRATEYKNRHHRVTERKEKANLAELRDKWQEYVDRLTTAIKALEREEAAENKAGD